MAIAKESRVLVKFPNLFVSFLQKQPLTNPNYDNVRVPSETSVCNECELSGSIAKGVMLCDFAYFAAVMAPDAPEDKFRVICDWGNWIFPFDDIFDNGELAGDARQSERIIDRLLSVFQSDKRPAHGGAAAIVRFHDDIWTQIRETSHSTIARSYARAMTDYCEGTLAQVMHAEDQSDMGLEVMLALRRKSVCVATLFALVRFGHGIVIPEDVENDPIIQEIETIGIDLTLMHNDLLSYDKEDAEGVPHNLVAVCRRRGLTAQASVDHVARLIDDRHDQLNRALSQIPSWDTETNTQVGRHIDGILDVVTANLYWSFRSGRFMTKEQKSQLRANGTILLRN